MSLSIQAHAWFKRNLYRVLWRFLKVSIYVQVTVTVSVDVTDMHNASSLYFFFKNSRERKLELKRFPSVSLANKQSGLSSHSCDIKVSTIDPRRPFKWLEFCVALRTVGFTPRFEKKGSRDHKFVHRAQELNLLTQARQRLTVAE